ncbi:MAG: acyl carrier protein [Candidatus Nanopelagicales bacterium]
MNEQRARKVLLEAVELVAPDVAADRIDPSASLREAAELDSMDFVTLVGLLADAVGADIPEDDYAQLDTVNDAVAYLASRLT